MKKLLLSLSLICSVLLAYSQCIPDAQYSGGGIYPNTANFNSTPAFVGQAYTQSMTVITPVDTVATVPILGAITADILSNDLINISGLPPNFTYICNPASCIFPGGTTKCVEIYSTTDPTTADIGIYPISFEFITHLSAPFVGAIDCTLVESGYVIEILDPSSGCIASGAICVCTMIWDPVCG